MANDVARLDLIVDSSQVRGATDDVKDLTKESERSQKSAEKFGRVWGTAIGLLSSAAIIGGVTAIFRSTIEAENAFAQLEAVLKSTGHAAGLTRRQLNEMAEDMASKSVFSVAAITDAQTRLLSYSGILGQNIPRAMQIVIDQGQRLGISLTQSAETIGRALESPTKAAAALAQQGFGAAFTQEVRQSIKALEDAGRSAEAQAVVMGILEESYAGAAEAARDTLGGAFAALKNAAGDLLEGDSGGEGVKGVTQAVNDLTATLSSPETKRGFASMVEGLLNTATAAATAASEFANFAKWIGEAAARAQGFVAMDDVGGVADRLEKVNAALEQRRSGGGRWAGAARTFTKWWDPLEAQEQARLAAKSTQELEAEQQKLLNFQKMQQQAAALAARRARWGNVQGSAVGSWERGGTPPAGVSEEAQKEAERLAKIRAREFQALQDKLRTEEQVIADSYAERTRIIEESTQAGSEQRERLSNLSRQLYEDEIAALREAQGREVEQLRQSLLTQEEAVRETYQRRLEIIAENTTLSEDAKEALRQRVAEEQERDLEAIANAEQRKRDMLWQGLLTEEEMMSAYHERRREEILRATAITEAERQELLRREEERYMAESAARERQRLNMMMGSAGDMFGALSQLMATYAQASDRENRKLFKVAQAFSLAQAVISIATGISKAQELGYPMNIFESIRVAAVGATQIAAIKSQSYAGAYDEGGQIPAGKWGWVGEYGPERVRGPVTVQGRKMSERYSGGGTGEVKVEVNVNMADGSVSTSARRSSETSLEEEQNARQLGILISNKVKEELLMQRRPGGLLY